MHYIMDIAVAVGLLCAWLLTQFLILPYIKLQMRRRESREHIPQAEEIWVQDEGMLYIDAVSASGVELMTFDPINKTLHRWKDSWPEWQQRLKVRTVFYTGRREPLKK